VKRERAELIDPGTVSLTGSLGYLNSLAMASTNIATLPRMSRDVLASLLSASSPSAPTVVDVRDAGIVIIRPATSSMGFGASLNVLRANARNCSDHVGGHIHSSKWVPSSTLDHRLPELVRELKDKKKVVFHCALSRERGPSAALRYMRERERVFGDEESNKQAVFVLDGGFVKWQEKYGNDDKLTEAYAEFLWKEY
jgi:rhodanese-related sulfurtransferase